MKTNHQCVFPLKYLAAKALSYNTLLVEENYEKTKARNTTKCNSVLDLEKLYLSQDESLINYKYEIKSNTVHTVSTEYTRSEPCLSTVNQSSHDVTFRSSCKAMSETQANSNRIHTGNLNIQKENFKSWKHPRTNQEFANEVAKTLNLTGKLDPNLLPGNRNENSVPVNIDLHPDENEERIAINELCIGKNKKEETMDGNWTNVKPDVVLFDGASHNFKFTNPTKLCIDSTLPFTIHIEINGQHKGFSGQYSYNYQPNVLGKYQSENFCKINDSCIDFNYTTPQQIQDNNNYVLTYGDEQLERQNKTISESQSSSTSSSGCYDIPSDPLQVNVKVQSLSLDDNESADTKSTSPAMSDENEYDEEDDFEVTIESMSKYSNHVSNVQYTEEYKDYTNFDSLGTDSSIHSEKFISNERLLLNNNNSHLSESQILQNLARNLKQVTLNNLTPVMNKWPMSGMIPTAPSIVPFYCEYPLLAQTAPYPHRPSQPPMMPPPMPHQTMRGPRFWPAAQPPMPPPPPPPPPSHWPFPMPKRSNRGRPSYRSVPPHTKFRYGPGGPFNMPNPRFQHDNFY